MRNSRSFSLDMSRMYLMHDALQRELDRLARVTARTDDDPKHLLSTAIGWELFKKFLHIHHTAEDTVLWPVMRELLTDRPDDLALLDAMEAEHAVIDPTLKAIDAALADPDTGMDVVGGLTDDLAGNLRAHLAHEEDETLALIDATLSPAQWQVLLDEHNRLGASDMPRLLAWILEDANPEYTESMFASIPDQARQGYLNFGKPSYDALDLWNDR